MNITPMSKGRKVRRDKVKPVDSKFGLGFSVLECLYCAHKSLIWGKFLHGQYLKHY